MRYLLFLLAASVAMVGCAPFRPGTLREPVTDEQHRLEKAYWSGFEDGADNGWKMGRESGLKAGKVTVSGCPDTVKAPSAQEQARILRETRTVERIDPNFQEASKEAVRQTDAEFCAKATEEWQRKAFCHGELK